jgi:hypothetical protein
MPDFYDIPKNAAMEAYQKEKSPSPTDQLLYAILAQLDKINEQINAAIAAEE